MNKDVLEAMADMDEPIHTLGEIADEMGKSKGAIETRLKELNENEDVCRKKVGARAVVWWLPGRTTQIYAGESDFVSAQKDKSNA